jgi:hypothetical protein
MLIPCSVYSLAPLSLSRPQSRRTLPHWLNISEGYDDITKSTLGLGRRWSTGLSPCIFRNGARSAPTALSRQQQPIVLFFVLDPSALDLLQDDSQSLNTVEVDGDGVPVDR